MAFPLIATSMVAARVTGGFYLFLSDRTRDPHEPDDARSCGNACAFSLSPRMIVISRELRIRTASAR